MRVAFLSPQFPAEMPEFTRGLAEVGAEVVGVGDVPVEAIPQRVRRYLSAYVQVPRLLDAASTLRHAVPELRRLRVERVECLWEVGVDLAAELRLALDLPGQGVEDARTFRDKVLMKARLSAVGLRVPRNARVQNESEAWVAAEEIGYPLIVKPIDGAGSASTYRVDSATELTDVLKKVAHLAEVGIEEFISGDEFTYDTVSIDGVPAFDSIAQYHPKPLEARSQEWISPGQIGLRDPHAAGLDEAVAFGRKVLLAMGMGTGFTHMEWFRKADGEIVFGEIAARAPGGRLVDQMNYANDFDVYREWARAVCWGTFEATAHRRFHVACVFKRAIGQGRIRRVEGMDRMRKELGGSLVCEDLLPIGSQRRDWKQTLLSDGCLIARHEDYATTHRMMQHLVDGVRIYAG